jgi:hypothetical protein
MKKRGFSQSIKYDSDVKMYQLPTAEYYRADDGLTIQTVFADANAAASSTKLKYGILVAEYVNLQCVLDEVR